MTPIASRLVAIDPRLRDIAVTLVHTAARRITPQDIRDALAANGYSFVRTTTYDAYADTIAELIDSATVTVNAGTEIASDTTAPSGAVRLLEQALHLRTHGEHAPGGDETWHAWEAETEAYLRQHRTTQVDLPRLEADIAEIVGRTEEV